MAESSSASITIAAFTRELPFQNEAAAEPHAAVLPLLPKKKDGTRIAKKNIESTRALNREGSLMLELFKLLSDDQIALLGCAAALTIAGTVMSLSYYIGRARLASSARIASNPSLLAEASPQLAQAAAVPTASGRRNAA